MRDIADSSDMECIPCQVRNEERASTPSLMSRPVVQQRSSSEHPGGKSNLMVILEMQITQGVQRR